MRSNLNTDDIQIGRDVLSFGEVLDGATERPGEVLTILREGTGESVQQVALATGIKVLTLQAPPGLRGGRLDPAARRAHRPREALRR